MKNKELKFSRTQNYFIKAAMDLIKTQGVKSASVRQIADKAGYAFSTTYSYFKDNKELLVCCVDGFLSEFTEFIKQKNVKVEGIPSIKFIIENYIEFLIRFPGIFDLIYTEELTFNPAVLLKVKEYPNTLCVENWDFCLHNRIYTFGEIEIIKLTLHTTIVGIPILQKRDLDSSDNLSALIKAHLNFIFK